jgi:hypothetical protein
MSDMDTIAMLSNLRENIRCLNAKIEITIGQNSEIIRQNDKKIQLLEEILIAVKEK